MKASSYLSIGQIPLDGPAKVFCKNEAIYRNAAFIKRKHNSICFHLVCGAVPARKMVIFKVDGKENLASLLTKSVPGHRRNYLRSKIMVTEDENKGDLIRDWWDDLQQIWLFEYFLMIEIYSVGESEWMSLLRTWMVFPLSLTF